jgi:hypothetical protein
MINGEHVGVDICQRERGREMVWSLIALPTRQFLRLDQDWLILSRQRSQVQPRTVDMFEVVAGV